MTPNQVTTVRLLVGVAAAGCFAIGAEPWWQAGAGLFILSMILDRADGDLARITGRTSPGGHKYDLFADSFCNALIFVGLGIGLRGGEYGLWAVPMGLLAGSAVAAVLWLVMRLEALEGERAGEIGNFFGFDPDDAMLAVPLAVFLGVREPLLAAAAIGAPAFTVIFYSLFLGKLRALQVKQVEHGAEGVDDRSGGGQDEER